jgi:hypothetical protein
VCAIPVNFTQGPGQDVGGGTLRFTYTWQSSTGRIEDLASSNCWLAEKVWYPGEVWPAPFPAFTPDNPYLGGNLIPGNGQSVDNHFLPPGPWRTPYFVKSFTANQVYRFHCPCYQNDNWIYVFGSESNPVQIVRSVQQRTDGRYKFLITKTGSSATIDPLLQ